MIKPNPKSSKTTLSLDPKIKAEAIRLAQKKMGAKASLSMFISLLILKASEEDKKS